MNPEALVVEAWLKAGIQRAEEGLCPEPETLEALAARQLPASEARRLTSHLACCKYCRDSIARLTAAHAVPTPTPIALKTLAARGEMPEAWRKWVHSLVHILPPDSDDRGECGLTDYAEVTPLRIDDQARLIVELMAKHPQSADMKVQLSLVGENARLDLCEVTQRSQRLYAVVDLSAFQPRPGILRGGVLCVKPVPAAVDTLEILPLLGELQDDGVSGTEFWDRFAPVAAACGDRLTAMLAHEISIAQGDQTTRPPRLRSGDLVADPADKTPSGRVQYALKTLQDYASLWRQCNPSEPPGAAGYIAQLRAVFAPMNHAGILDRHPVESEPMRSDMPVPRSGRSQP